jgi:hypothetical protein
MPKDEPRIACSVPKSLTEYTSPMPAPQPMEQSFTCSQAYQLKKAVKAYILIHQQNWFFV